MNIQWDKTIGGKDDEYLSTVINTDDGGYLAGGYSMSGISGDKTEMQRGSFDYWIVKLDASGNIQWDKTLGGKDGDNLNAVLQTSDGGYLLGGHSASGISGEKSDTARGYYDYWIVKTDESGNVQWDKTIGGASADYLSSMLQTEDGGFLLGGMSSSNKSGDKKSPTRGRDDYWLVKINALGSIEWDKTFGGNKDDYLTAIQKTIDGGYILGGYSDSKNSGDKSQKGRGYRDIWVIKLNADADIEWDKTIGGSKFDELASLAQTSDAGFILAGWSSSDISGEKSENTRGTQGWYDFWIVKLNRNGSISWDKTIGGDGMELGCNIIEYPKNNYRIAGSSKSNISGEKKEDSRGSYDYWLISMKYDELPDATDAVNSQQATFNAAIPGKNSVIAYPNPVKDILYIQTNGKAIYTLTNQAGVTVLTQTIKSIGTMNVSRLMAGIYYLKNSNTGVVQKIIVQ